MFAECLKKAKVKTTLNNTKETIHGYDTVEDSEITKQSINKRIKFLKSVFEKGL